MHDQVVLIDKHTVEGVFSNNQVKVGIVQFFTLTIPFFAFFTISLLSAPFLWIPSMLGRIFFMQKKLFVTNDELVLEQSFPTFFIFMYNKETKRILLDQVVDVLVTQTWLQKKYGLYNLVVKNSSHFGDYRTSDLEVSGITNANEIAKTILSKTKEKL